MMKNKKFLVACFLLFSFVFFFFDYSTTLAQFGLENFSDDSDNAFFSANQSIPETVTRIISIVIGVIGVILLVMLIYGGVLYATSSGNQDQVDRGKKVLTYSFIGIIIVAISFAITNYVVVGLFSDDIGQGQGSNESTGEGDDGDGISSGSGDSADASSNGDDLINEGEAMVRRGEELREEGESLFEDGDEEAGRTLVDDGEELINGGNTRIEEGRTINERNLSGSGSSNSRTTTTPDVDIDCKQNGDNCGIFRSFCCTGLECDGAVADSGFPAFAGTCAYGNPECKEEGERCVTLGQECCAGLTCIGGDCIR